MKDIAAYMLRKILITQPKGPYIFGGACAGSVLAYEIASQLRAAGEEVSLLLLLDAPIQPYLKSSRALTTRLKHPRFYLYRAGRVGWRRSLANLYGRAIKHSPRPIRSRLPEIENNVAHRLLETAAFNYQHQDTKGKYFFCWLRSRTRYLISFPDGSLWFPGTWMCFMCKGVTVS